MIILTIRTDKPEAEIGLYVGKDHQLAYKMWQAHRELSATLHYKIKLLLSEEKLNWADVEGIVCYQGPGSFTGLRIGLTVANTLASELGIPIVGTTGASWLSDGLECVQHGNKHIILPDYGAPVRTTTPRK